ncbi:hypothetical protein SAMN05421780_108174 [Flexibacter flexilis DSM 6793]|uniref:Uncharacterized protein n=1 Tax=Flexibacter flexilis DSM 6793 TaxID=927664 RepID=A0A1I1LEE1_9BACT|nr:hypothetical protein SAMN05421780_108174 [Flexibacter flexilis DSM 6793]
MTISKIKARAKAKLLLEQIYTEIQWLAEEEGMAYCSIYAIPSGRRLARYAKRAGYQCRCWSMFDGIRHVELCEKITFKPVQLPN